MSVRVCYCVRAYLYVCVCVCVCIRQREDGKVGLSVICKLFVYVFIFFL